MGYFEAVETRARLIEILAEFIDIDVPGILLNFSLHQRDHPRRITSAISYYHRKWRNFYLTL